MNASCSDPQTAVLDGLGDAPRGIHAKRVPQGNGPGTSGRAVGAHEGGPALARTAIGAPRIESAGPKAGRRLAEESDPVKP